MKVAAEFTNETEAQLVKDLLLAENIESHIQGAKEYASIVLGGNDGRYQLLVPETDLERAQALIASVQKRPFVASEPSQENYFRRAVFYEFAAALLLPIVFNYASLKKAGEFWRHSRKDFKAQIKMLLIFILQIPTVIALIYSISTIETMSRDIMSYF